MKLLLTFFLLIFISKSYAQDYDLDSLVKTHKKVAILPIKVKYNAQKLQKVGGLKELKSKELEDGFLLQERFCEILRRDSSSLNVDIQLPNETNSLLAENEITLQDLKDLPSDFICEALKVDGVIEIEIRLNQHLPDRVNTENTARRAIMGVLMANPVIFASAIVDSENKGVYSKMTIRDGKIDEVIKDITLDFNDGIFESNDKVIEKILLTNFKKSPYYKK